MWVAMGDQVLQHLVHGSHKEDKPELGHRHGDETPQEDGGADGVTEGNSAWTTGGQGEEHQDVYQAMLPKRA